MATDQLYQLITQDPQLFLCVYKLYLQASCTSPQVVDAKEGKRDGAVSPPLFDHSEELLVEEDEEEIKQEEQVEVVKELPIVEKKKNICLKEENALLYRWSELLGERTCLSNYEFCKVFEGGEKGLFFKEVDRTEYSFQQLVDFLLDHVFPHSEFVNIQKFPITLRVADLFQANRKLVIQSLIGCDISYLQQCLSSSEQLRVLTETMKLTFDLKLRGSSQAVTKIFVSCPTFDFNKLFGPLIKKWHNLEEIDCEYYSLIIAPLVVNLDEKFVIEVTIRDQVHPSILQEIIESCPALTQFNLNLKFLLEFSHLISNKNFDLGVLIPSGQSRLFKLLFKDHKLGAYPYYPIEDEHISSKDFRKIWSEELGVIGLIYNLQEEILSFKRISSKLLNEEGKRKVKNMEKKVDRLVDRIDEAESIEFIEKFEECLLEFEEVKKL